MTQKRILRANTKAAAREKDLLMRDAFRAHWADIDDPKAVTLVSQLAEGEPEPTALQLFGMVNQLIDEVVEATGETREAVFARLVRG